MISRIATAFILALLAAFCDFGFLASYEPPGSPGMRIVYAALGIGCLVQIGKTSIFRAKTAERSS
jgi:hypothetical protein